MIEQHYGGKDGFWKFLMDRDNEGCLLGCSIKGNGKVGQLSVVICQNNLRALLKKKRSKRLLLTPRLRRTSRKSLSQLSPSQRRNHQRKSPRKLNLNQRKRRS